MFWAEIKKNIKFFIWFFFLFFYFLFLFIYFFFFLVVKFSVYFNRRVFEMRNNPATIHFYHTVVIYVLRKYQTYKWSHLGNVTKHSPPPQGDGGCGGPGCRNLLHTSARFFWYGWYTVYFCGVNARCWCQANVEAKFRVPPSPGAQPSRGTKRRSGEGRK